ncbi:hypothetical protein FF38_08575 [Lucilia cuprina]|uniref:Uncharacterized protein n=1 Tax=Lucilia cuprina TaxID=7375 RepID=A0A0L0C4T2_LUCCU|nr:hypothetical protein FF38_08575 [Lucilia cuprina]
MFYRLLNMKSSYTASFILKERRRLLLLSVSCFTITMHRESVGPGGTCVLGVVSFGKLFAR